MEFPRERLANVSLAVGNVWMSSPGKACKCFVDRRQCMNVITLETTLHCGPQKWVTNCHASEMTAPNFFFAFQWWKTKMWYFSLNWILFGCLILNIVKRLTSSVRKTCFIEAHESSWKAEHDFNYSVTFRYKIQDDLGSDPFQIDEFCTAWFYFNINRM